MKAESTLQEACSNGATPIGTNETKSQAYETLDTPQTQKAEVGDGFTKVTPVIENWKPAPGFSFLGATAGYFILFYIMLMMQAALVMVSGEFIGSLISALLWLGVSAVYSLVVYPSYFTDKPLIKSSRAISFLNYAIGWIVFGALWNNNLRCSNLEKHPKKGYSYIVFAVLEFLYFLYLCL